MLKQQGGGGDSTPPSQQPSSTGISPNKLRPADYPDAAAGGTRRSLVMFQAMETQNEAEMSRLKSKMTSSRSPVRPDLEQIVARRVSASSLVSAAAAAGDDDPDSPAGMPAVQKDKSSSMVEIGKKAAAKPEGDDGDEKKSSSLFRMSTFEDATTDYKSVKKPEYQPEN